jgi:hypothetical protein
VVEDQWEVRADFDGGAITNDGGGMLLPEVEKRTGIVERFGAASWIVGTQSGPSIRSASWVGQRVYGLALQYEDLKDH